MKNSLRILFAAAASLAAAAIAGAQPAVKLATVDMAKLYDNHYKTIEQNAKIQADDQKAQEEVDKMNKEGNALVEEYKTLNEQANSPALSAEAKSKAQNEAQKKLEAIQNKQREVQTFIQNTRNSLGQRLNTFRALMLEEITKLVVGVTKLDHLQFDSRDDAQAENWRKMLLATAQDIRVIVIKLADRLHNMKTLNYLKAEIGRAHV